MLRLINKLILAEGKQGKVKVEEPAKLLVISWAHMQI